jgi:hypothetical protein
MPYSHNLDLDHNDVACLTAQILSKDQLTNNWSFQGFPAIRVKNDGEAFQIHLSLPKGSAGPAAIPYRTAARGVHVVRSQCSVDGDIKRTVVPPVQSLESNARHLSTWGNVTPLSLATGTD